MRVCMCFVQEHFPFHVITSVLRFDAWWCHVPGSMCTFTWLLSFLRHRIYTNTLREKIYWKQECGWLTWFIYALKKKTREDNDSMFTCCRCWLQSMMKPLQCKHSSGLGYFTPHQYRKCCSFQTKFQTINLYSDYSGYQKSTHPC